MFDIGLQEMLLIMVLALLVFGPSKLPELGKMVGRALREFRRVSDEFRSTVETNLKINEIDEPPTAPGQGLGSYGFPPAPAPAVEPAISPVAAVTADGEQAADAAGGDLATAVGPGPEPYWAQRGSRLCHHRDCAWVARIPEGQRLGFDSTREAREQGFSACPICEPWGSGLAV